MTSMKNNHPPYLTKTITCYNPHFGDSRVCKCGHTYYRHFDSYEDNAPVGCKYCSCRIFVEAALDARPLILTKDDIENESTPFLGIVRLDHAEGEVEGVLLPLDYITELGRNSQRLMMQISEFPELAQYAELFETFVAISKEAGGH